MAKFDYKFQVIRGNRFSPAELWSWKWGDWHLSAKWTSDGSPDADFDTANARKGLQTFQNLLMLAVPSAAQSPFAKNQVFDQVIILAFEKGDSTGTPVRSTVYDKANVVGTPILRDFTAAKWAGDKQPKYNEVLLSISGNVTVT